MFPKQLLRPRRLCCPIRLGVSVGLLIFHQIAFAQEAPSSPGKLASKLAGSVVDYRGNPVKDATVCCVGNDSTLGSSSTMFYLRTDSDGNFHFGKPIRLPVTLIVTADSLSPRSRQVGRPAEAENLAFKMLPGRQVRFEVVDSAGKPIEKAVVRSLSWNDQPGLQLIAETDSLGRVGFRNAPGDEVQYAITRTGYAPTAITIAASPKTHRVTVESIQETSIQKPSATRSEAAAKLQRRIQRSQPLDRIAVLLDESGPDLANNELHDLTSGDWANGGRFQVQASKAASVSQMPDGFRVDHTASDKREATAVRFLPTVRGDFDIEADYQILQSNRKRILVSLVLPLVDRQGKVVRTTCQLDPDRDLEPFAGSLRVARRGTMVSILLQTPAKIGYHCIRQFESLGSVLPGGTIAMEIAASPGQELQMLWKRLQIRADSISGVEGDGIDGNPAATGKAPLPAVATYQPATNLIRLLCRASPGTKIIGSPNWSPDQKSIVFHQSSRDIRHASLRVVSLDGKRNQHLGTGSMPRFSPDGSMIAFSAAGEGVGVMRSDGTERRIVSSKGLSIHWLGASRKLAYSSGGQFYSFDLATEMTTPLIRGDAADRYTSLYWNSAWSHDANRVVFKGRSAESGDDDVAIFDLRQPDRIWVLVSDVQIQDIDFSWSADDREILFLSTDTNSGKAIMNVVASDGSGVVRQSIDKTEFTQLTGAHLSPDGGQIAVSGLMQRQLPHRIYRMDADGQNLRRITWNYLGYGYHLSPYLSTDGKRMTFEFYNGNRRQSRIATMNPEGSDVRDIAPGLFPSFTSDGNAVVYATGRGTKMTDLRSGESQAIELGGTWAIQASPVDDRLACVVYRSGQGYNLVVASGANGSPTDLLQGDLANTYGSIGGFFAWSFDGKEIAFFGRRKGTAKEELAIVSSSGSDAGFTSIEMKSKHEPNISWHPDGKRLIISIDDPAVDGSRMYWIDRNPPHGFDLVPGQGSHTSNGHAHYSRDGKNLYFKGRMLYPNQ